VPICTTHIVPIQPSTSNAASGADALRGLALVIFFGMRPSRPASETTTSVILIHAMKTPRVPTRSEVSLANAMKASSEMVLHVSQRHCVRLSGPVVTLLKGVMTVALFVSAISIVMEFPSAGRMNFVLKYLLAQTAMPTAQVVFAVSQHAAVLMFAFQNARHLMLAVLAR